MTPEESLLIVHHPEKLLAAAARAAGLPGFSPRDCRKLFITRGLQMGVNPETLAFIVGHQDSGYSIRQHYYEYCKEHTDDAVMKINGGNSSGNEEDWATDEKFYIKRAIQIIFNCPPHIAKTCVAFIRRLAETLQEGAYDAALTMVALPHDGLPDRPSEARPTMPRRRALALEMLIASHIRCLLRHKGLSVNQLHKAIPALPKTTIYDMLRGMRQHDSKLALLADYFKLPVSHFTDRKAQRYDCDLVVANVKFLARKYGVSRLPCPAEVGAVVADNKLPCGRSLKALAAFLGIPLETFLTTDISKRPELGPVVLPAPEQVRSNRDLRRARRENLAKNLKVLLLLRGINATDLSRITGIRLNRIHDYVAGRHFPPPDTLETIAARLGSTANILCRLAPELDLAAIGRRVAELLVRKGCTAATAAGKMGIAELKFCAVANGEELPNGFQLHRIAEFLGVTPAEILGVNIVIYTVEPTGIDGEANEPQRLVHNETGPKIEKRPGDQLTFDDLLE